MNLLTTTRGRREDLSTKRNRKVGEEIVIRTQRKRELSRHRPGYVNGTVKWRLRKLHSSQQKHWKHEI